MSVSVPEKTLEHWASLYLTYRYRSKAALWWPVDGADIQVGHLPSRPGKAVELELKTTIAQATQHKVVVDIGQLWEYEQRPTARQPFYVFPRPRWEGELRVAARANYLHEADIAFSRSGQTWWFAEWMVVLTTAEVAAVLRAEVNAWGRRDRGHKEVLVRYRHPTARQPHWRTQWGGVGGVTPASVPWRELWTDLETCGRAGWPQLVRLPVNAVSRRGRLRRDVVLSALRSAADLNARERREQEWATFGADGDDGFVPLDETPPEELEQESTESERGSRIGVFIDARALFRTEADD